MKLPTKAAVLFVSVLAIPYPAANAADVAESPRNVDQARCDDTQDKVHCGSHRGHKQVTELATPSDPDTDFQNYVKPYLGKLYFKKDSGTHYCSAQFVAPYILLTAAHCTHGVTLTDFCFIPEGQTYTQSSCTGQQG